MINKHEFKSGKPVRKSQSQPVKRLISRAFLKPYQFFESYFLPKELYKSYSSEHIVARLLVDAIAILLFPLLAFLGLFLSLGPEHFEPGPRIIAIGAASTITLWFCLTLILIRNGRSLWARLLFCSCASLVCLAIIQLTGGLLQSVATPFIFIPPLIYFYFYGHQMGAKASLVIFPLAILLDALNQRLGSPIPNATSMANPYLNELLSVGAVYVVVAVSLYSMLKSIYMMRTTLFSQQAKLKVLANKDDLTGIANSRAFADRLKERCKSADRHDLKFGVIYVDLDRFKPVNDEHGHRIGDEVLVEIARRLRTFCQLDDSVARIGGDEFVLIINRIVDAESSDRLITAIKAMLELPLKINNLTLKLTASVGYCIYRDQVFEREQLINRADKSMYRDKHGKQRSTV